MPKHAKGQLRRPDGTVWTTTAPNEHRFREAARAWEAEVVSVEMRVRKTDPFGRPVQVAETESEDGEDEDRRMWEMEVEMAQAARRGGAGGGELKYVGGRRY